MQTCSNCGATVRESARFCTACGTQLNDASSGSSPFSWGAAIEQSPVAHDASAPSGWPASPTDGESSSATGDGIESSDEATTTDQHSTEEVDEETGFVLSDPHEAPLPGVVDATELDELIEVSYDNQPSSEGNDEPDLSILEDEAVMGSNDDEGEDQSSQETLAAWAQDWSVGNPDDTESLTPDATVVEVSADDDEEEDVLEKAERLIAQLQALVPKLAKPKPADPNQKLKPQLLADELEERTDGSQWADLRDVLEKARDNPNDITHLMGVSGNASRLLDLLDEREYLAQRASSVAQRLRNPDVSSDD